MSNARYRLPIQVVISDTGPLIGLAACRHLHILGEFQRPVRVPDVIKAECLRHPQKIGAKTLFDWFSAPGCPAELLPTPFMSAWTQAEAKEALDPNCHESVGIGDAATAWILGQAQLGNGLQTPTLVLTEDGPFGDGVIRDRFPEVHVLSTRAFLRSLENFGKIASAADLINEIAQAGRQLARYMADRPGRPLPNGKTTWTEMFEAAGSPKSDIAGEP